MSNLFRKIVRKLKTVSKDFKTDCHFSFIYAFLRIIEEISKTLHLSKLFDYAHAKRDQWILNYLQESLSPIIHKAQETSNSGEFSHNAPIWICWWTGEDTAPPLVKQCIRSIRNNAGHHPVNFVDQTNYMNYISIPEYMLQKVASGHMGIAHLADYIRVALLAQYGGLWLDATIYCSREIDETIFSYPFYTCKSEPQPCPYLSKMQWVTFVLGGWKGNLVYRYLQSAFESYWKTNKYAIDYLFFDHMIELARQSLPAFKDAMDSVPVNNPQRDALQAAMNAAIHASQFASVIDQETLFYKLSWRESYSETTASGEDSIYRYFILQ